MTHPPFPFFVGCPRSGTTLVRAMFDSHPDMAVPPEAPFLFANGSDPAVAFDAEAFAALILGTTSFVNWGVDPSWVRAVVSVADGGAFADGVRALYSAYASEHGKSRYADKTPEHVGHLDEIATAFPEARIVHVIRDGRDVALSLAESFPPAGSTAGLPWRPADTSEAARYWRSRVERGRISGRRLGQARYHEIRYEQLVEEPEDVLRRACLFLDLPFDAAMLRYYERFDAVVGGFREPARAVHRHLAEPLRRDLRSWRRDMSPADILRFEAEAGRLLSELRYERSVPRIPITSRVALSARRLRIFAKRSLPRTALGASVRRNRVPR